MRRPDIRSQMGSSVIRFHWRTDLRVWKVRGLISISENISTIVGMEFLAKGGKALILGSGGVVIIDEKELLQGLELAARLDAEAGPDQTKK